MKVLRKAQECDAFCFVGTPVSAQEAADWVSDHDLVDLEVSAQGDREPLALDIITSSGIQTLEARDWLVVCDERISAVKEADFRRDYEIIK